MNALDNNAETFRLMALAHLLQHEVKQAKLDALSAMDRQPEAESVQRTLATIEYYSSLVEVAIPRRPVAWPQPVAWQLVKRDDMSRKDLESAEATFRELLKSLPQSGQERENLEGWLLGCLANNPQRQEEAAGYSKELLDRDPTHIPALVWSTAREYDVEYNHSKEALRKLIEEESCSPMHVLALAEIHLLEDEPDEAQNAVEEGRRLFEYEDDLWGTLQIRCLIAKGEEEQALKQLHQLKTEEIRPKLQAFLLSAVAQEKQDYGEVIDYLEQKYEETKDAYFLLELCELWSQQEEWGRIAEYASELVDAVPTAEALRIAALGAYNANQYRLSLDMLDDNDDVFPEKQLPSGLRHLRSLCLRELGILPEAIAEAEQLANEEPSTKNLLSLAEMYAGIGNYAALGIVAQQLQSRKDLDVIQLVALAQHLQHHDKELACSLWKNAQQAGVPDRLVGAMIGLGYRLELEGEMGQLIERMQHLGAEGRCGIQQGKGLEDLRAQIESYQERARENATIYARGEAPIHLISESWNRPLSEIYHALPDDAEGNPDPVRSLPIFVRHGSRTLPEHFPQEVPQARLNLDVTAILLSEHLSIFDDIIQHFGPIRIPSLSVHALLDMRHRTSEQQPGRNASIEEIIEYENLGRIGTTDLGARPVQVQMSHKLPAQTLSAVELAQEKGGYAVSLFPLHDLENDETITNSSLSKEIRQCLVNCRALADALIEHGPLSKATYEPAVQALHGQGENIEGVMKPKPGAILVLLPGVAETLFEANLISFVCDKYEVYIDVQELERMRHRVRCAKRAKRDATWLDGLIEKIRTSIAHRDIQLIERSEGIKPEGAEREYVSSSECCLRELLDCGCSDNDIIWIDDRFMNAFMHRDGVPIIGVNDILQALVACGVLTEKEYYQKIHRCRSANMRFIPVQEAELLHALGQANVRNDSVIETNELKIIRQYVAACAEQADSMQKSSHDDLEEGLSGDESLFWIKLHSATCQSLGSLWTIYDDPDESIPRCNWLLDNVFMDYLGLIEMNASSTRGHDLKQILGYSLSGVLSAGIQIKGSMDIDAASPRKQYFNWVDRTFLNPIFDACPELIPIVAEIIKDTLSGLVEQLEEESDVRRTAILLLQIFYDDLPIRIKDEISHDADFMANIGIEIRSVATIAGYEFDAKQFWKCAEGAVNGSREHLKSINENEFLLRPMEQNNDGYGFAMVDKETSEQQEICRPEFAVLSQSVAERRNFLNTQRYWFDCRREPFERACAEIATAERAHHRMGQLQDRWTASTTMVYAGLRDTFERGEKLSFDEIRPPSGAALLRHFRLSEDVLKSKPISDAIEEAGEILINEEEMARAIRRLSYFPVPLPANIDEAVRSLGVSERRELIGSLIAPTQFPVGPLHFLSLLSQHSRERKGYVRLGKRSVRALLSTNARSAFEAFRNVLRWVAADFQRWQETRDWPTGLRLLLAWGHAGELTRTMFSVGADVVWISDIFQRKWREIRYVPFEEYEPDRGDIAHPANVDYVSFCVSGLNYALDDHNNRCFDSIHRDQLASMVLPQTDGGQIIEPAILKDRSKASDRLGAFLGRDCIAIAGELLQDGGVIGNLSEAGALDIGTAYFDQLSENIFNRSTWLVLASFLDGEWPPSGDMTQRLLTVTKSEEFEKVFDDSLEGALAAGAAVFPQIKYLNASELEITVQRCLLKLAKNLAECEIEEGNLVSNEGTVLMSPRETHALLSQWAFELAEVASDSEEKIRRFVSHLGDIAGIWPHFGRNIKPMLRRFCTTLPPQQARHFWPLLVDIRGE